VSLYSILSLSVRWPLTEVGIYSSAGNFSLADTNISPSIAQANIGATGGCLGSPAYSPATGFRFRFSEATAGLPYRIQASPSLESGNWSELTNFIYTGPIVIADTSAPTAPREFAASSHLEDGAPGSVRIRRRAWLADNFWEMLKQTT
jgi:hypothetical protein